ncbi:hypothetical protein SAMN04489867_1831 [Pedococcus dokdonensis]|uniref:Uncharacterized protein n=1 Tax=Pedococcus dokdonensis TaxID=443156 RepID=A0A1H0R3K6_9MICO|nr:hypothetical protein [Pedococcus dokdonensis]SDP24114.1 hypothetical protein SAMN04489867_1831 [Pedococcus dokdonensis]
MTLWDDVPASARNSGALDQVRPLLQGLTGTDDGLSTDDDGTWHSYTATGTWPTPITLDPGSGGFGNGGTTSTTPIEFPDPSVSVQLGLHQTGGVGDGGWRVTLTVPIVLVRLPFLRGAELDGQGQLRANGMPVTFTLPSLRIRAKQLAGQSVGVELLSAETGGTPVDHIYEFISMNPPYALVGPSDVVGFAFRTAVLDLSGEAGPNVPAVPGGARAMPSDWQGFYLPEARLFVAPTGLQGIAVSAGVRDLWIGMGVHAGVTGIFEAEVVNRGGTPTMTVSFRTASGEWIGDPGTGAAQLPEQATLFVDTAGGLAPITVSISVDGVVTADDRVALTVPSTGSLSITVTATDGAGNPTTRTLSAVRRSTPSGAGSGDSTVTVTPTNSRPHAIRRVSVTATHVKLTTDPPVAANWTWTGGSAGPSIEADVPVAAGATVNVTATLPATAPQVIDAYYLFAQPDPFSPNMTTPDPQDPTFPDALRNWATNPSNVHVGPASTRTNPGSSISLWDALTPAVITQIGANTPLTVKGYASWEGPDHDTTNDADYNRKLSERRRDVMVHLLHRKGFTNVTAGAADGFTQAKAQTTSVEGTTPPPPAGSGAWWRARATTAGNGEETITARVERVVRPPAREVDRTPPTGGRPDCFRKIGVRVELLRSTFIRAEVYGEFDIETAAETALRQHSQPALRSGPRNPSDGICTFLVRLRIAEDRDSWLVSAEFRAAEADLDGLAQMDSAHSDQTALNVLGALSILAPLSSAAAELSPAAGALVSIGSIALGASSLINTQKLILRGGELVVSQGTIAPDGSATVDPRGTTISILLDIEVTFTFDLTIVKVNPDHPVTTRYKAIGVRSSWDTAPDPANPGHIDYLPVPVFDPSKGYTLDIPAGALTASPPLDELLRVLGFRVSRDNPTYMEVEVGLGLDLGIVTVDTVRVRARLDGPFELTLTKLAASLEIPGVLHGKGSLEFTPFGFKGYFDLTITPINIRASAVLAVETKNGVTGVLIGAEVELPVPILLGNSGLGIYGFLGGVGINYARDESPYASRPVPALDWLTAQLQRGQVMHPDGWTHTAGSYAFAAGMLLGTADGGFVVHLKGIILIEVPGPRLLLVMKADVLKMPPILKNASQSATFLAVLDIDFGRGTITLGIVAAYEIEKLLKIRVPVTAFFDTHQPQNWLVDLGSYEDRVTIEVLDVIKGSGYLMVHGNGISIPVLPPVTGGMAIATGFHISCVLMGSKSIGLYLEVAGGFDAILGFDPFFLAGKIYVRGELRLFIISIGASAELDVLVGRTTQTSPDVTYVHGEVCGEVDFFFFSVKGCVSLTIGNTPSETLTPPPLVAGVSLVSRSPALVEGTGAERAIDAKLADAVRTGTPPSVPLDAIPVVLFNTAPNLGGPVMGGTPLGNSGARPWSRLGDRWWTYEITSVTLTGDALPDLQPAPPAGKTPSSWWKQTSPADPASGPALALLNWLPTPFSRALPYGETLTTSVTDRWGTVCNPAAPPAPVLWTFDGKPPGPSTVGWTLDGIPWPDPPDTLRTRPVHGECDVTEAWRTGDTAIDILQGTNPAVVLGDAVRCCTPRRGRDVPNPLKAWVATAGSTYSHRSTASDDHALGEVAAALAAGTSLGDAQATRLEQGWDPQVARAAATTGLGCEGRILRSPTRDSDQPAPFGTEEDMERVKRAWGRLKFTPSDLRDTLRIRPEGGAGDLTLLLLVPEELFVRRLVVRWLDEKGNVLDQRGLDSDDRLDSDNPLPAAWVDGDGPWFDPVCRAGQVAARVASRATWPQALLLVHSRDIQGVASVEIGWDATGFAKDQTPPAFHLVAMTGVLTSEATRWSWDTSVVTSEQEAVQTALTQDPDDHALLVPGRTYTVSVAWRAASVKQDNEPTTSPSWDGGHTDTFQFKADGVDRAPTDLSPWLLASAPGMDDVGVLCAEPIRIALATQNVAALFDAYGKELRVIVLSASGKHPAPPGGGAPGTGFTVPLEADGVHLKKLKGLAVSTPWEEAVIEVLGEGQRCIDISGERVRHDVLELPYDLEPLTDYLIDVHAVPKGAPDGARGLVHRIGFTTSAFGTVAQLGDLLREARWRHTVIPSIGPLAALPDAPTGDQLDTAFQSAGLTTPQTPNAPMVRVLWSTDPTPTPQALVVECSETLWRSRLMPTQVQGPVDSVDPTHHWWAARPADWLSLKPSTAAAPAGALPAAGITRIIRGPGLGRAVVLLAPAPAAPAPRSTSSWPPTRSPARPRREPSQWTSR